MIGIMRNLSLRPRPPLRAETRFDGRHPGSRACTQVPVSTSHSRIRHAKWMGIWRRALVGAGLTALFSIALATERPIELYAASLALFGEVDTRFNPGDPPRRVPAYGQDRKQIVGHVEAQTQVPGEAGFCCEVTLVSTNGTRHPVSTRMWGYEAMAMVSYQPAVKATESNDLWVAIDSTVRGVWVKLPTEQVRLYEELAVWIEDPSRLCETPQPCKPASDAFVAEAKRAGEAATCYGSPYELKGTLFSKGRRYYRLELYDPAATWLPRVMYAPTRDENGQHTAFFTAKGC